MVLDWIVGLLSSLLGGGGAAAAPTAATAGTAAAGTAATAAAPIAGATAGTAGAGGLTGLLKGAGGWLQGAGKGLLKQQTGIDVGAGEGLTGMLKGAGKHLVKQQTGLEGTPQTPDDWMTLLSTMERQQEPERPMPQQQIPSLMGQRQGFQGGLQSLLDEYLDYY